jgi:glyoxylase-like metal-dependent hydrolase (beta-lactamase superfamily II)
VVCEIEHMGGDHSQDSSFLFVREDRILFTGDSLGPSVYGGPQKYTSDNFLRLLTGVFASGAELIVESHGSPMGREAFEADIEPWAALARAARRGGPDKDRILEELAREIGPAAISADLRQAAEWHVEGMRVGLAQPRPADSLRHPIQ